MVGEFRADHSGCNLVNCQIRQTTTQVGLQNNNLAFCDLIAVVIIAYLGTSPQF